MILAADPGAAALLLLAIAAAGVAGGFLSGLIGIGGGGILVPVLYEAFGFAGVPEDVRMHMAVGSTLAVIAPTVLTSLAGHWKRGAVDVDVVKSMAPGVLLGVLIGTLVAKDASSEVLRWVWVVVGSLMVVKMVFARDDWRFADSVPGPWGLATAGLVIGLVSTLMGIGGATFTVPFLTMHGKSMLQSVATATGIGPVIALPGIIGYAWSGWTADGLPPLSVGYVNLAALLIAPISMFAAPFGVRMAHGIDKRRLELAFALFVACVVVRFLWSLVG